ncbi:PAS domain S-box protein [Acidobacteriota bacterium]
MKDENKSIGQLIKEITELRNRVSEIESAQGPQLERKPGSINSVESAKDIIESLLIPVLITRLSDQKVLYGNKQICRHYGYSREELLKLHTTDFYFDLSDRPRVLEALSQEENVHSFELRTKKADGTLTWILASVCTITFEGEPSLLLGIQQLDQQKKVEEELRQHRDHLDKRVRDRTTELHLANESLQREFDEREAIEGTLRVSEERWRSLIQHNPDFIITLDREQRILFLNRTATVISAKDVYGSSIMGWVVPEHRDLVKKTIERVFVTGEPDRYEAKARIDDEYRWFMTTVGPVFEDGRVVSVILVSRDITEGKEMEVKLRSLASQASLSEERERKRIASEIHDYVTQPLAMAKIKLGAILAQESSEKLKERLKSVRSLCDNAIHSTRSLTFELSPPVLYELGFEPAVEWLVERMEEDSELSLTFEDDGNPKPLKDEIKVLLFVAVRELLFNVAKHSRATNAQIRILRNGSEVQVEVSDDGVGFDMEKSGDQVKQIEGFGLFSIRERLGYLGGRLEIETAPGQGARARVIAPLDIDDGGETESNSP